MNMQMTETKGFSIRRQVSASRERVWQAWTNPDELTRWHHPKGVVTPRETIHVDLREGGTYRYTMVHEESGQEYPTTGIYLEVSPPERLIFTWGNAGDAEHEVPIVTVTLTEKDGGTEVLLQVQRVDGHKGDGQFYDGWDEALEGLADYAGGS